MKTCTKCHNSQPFSNFYNRKIAADGKNSHCKTCENQEIYQWRKNNKENQARILRKARLKKKYGISPEQYDELLALQNNKCAVCFRDQSEINSRFVVDHNHVTGQIRGLLCNYCNHKIVGKHSDGTEFRRLAAYIEGGVNWFVPNG